MPTRFRLLPLLLPLPVAVAIACGSSDGSTGLGGGGSLVNGSFSAKIDGATFTPTAAAVVSSSGIVSIGAGNASGRTIGFAWVDGGCQLRGDRDADDHPRRARPDLPLRERPATPLQRARRRDPVGHGASTDGVGFEPTVRYERTHTFQACALNHSATRPCECHAPAAPRRARGPQTTTRRQRQRVACNHECRHGQGEIRTHDTVAGMPVFETGAFNHSATCPTECGN